ncbi:transporter substrate-binding domain-containing protein [Pseudomonas parasichuanensis]|uniref:transporter substrate-binding domain-containing protein n=1 Tax=Pseudomonas parasichuanensis TaxID=2892329 RepID=UPI001F21A935|nr:transporter substrate-binding domain-containing protein [Pseudomonas parasichuanensis]
MRKGLLAVLLCCAPLLAADPLPQLYGRSSLSGPRLTPDDAQLRWLWQRQQLRLAVVRPDNPPLDILGTGHDYEGISADYAGLLAGHLQLPVQIQVYGSHNAAIKALRAHQVDLLASVTARQAGDGGLKLSQPYAQDLPVVVLREDEPAADVPLRLAMREGYRELGSILARFPQAQVQVFPSTRAALGALAFGQADLFLGGALESQYLIGKGLVGPLEAFDSPDLESQPLGFAMHPDDTPLHGLVDAVLASIEPQEHARIRRRWGGQGLVERGPLQLSDKELGWVQGQGPLRVLLNDQYPPISYRDGEGRLRGLAVDVLQRIGRRTGLTFDLVAGGTLERMIERTARGEADLIAGITPSDEREQHLAFSRSFASSARVLVTADSSAAASSLEQLAGLRLAVARSGYPKAYLRQHYPGIQLVEADGPVDAVWRVASGRAEAALVPLIGARALTERMAPTRLKISASLSLDPAYFAFASPRGALELQAILNKALLSLSPQEMDALARRWRSEVIVADSFWQRYRLQVLQGFAAVALSLLLALAWVRYLRRLVRVREQAERELADQLAFMRVMIDGTPHPIYVCDQHGCLLTCNNSYLQALQVSQAAVIGQPLGQSEALAWQGAWREVLASGRVQVEDLQVSLAAGRQRTLSHWMLPYRGLRDGQAGVIAGWIDVTERQHLQVQLQAAKDDADSANQAKTHFLATMSHEIRTPLNAVLGMLELALRKAEQGVLDRLSIEVASDSARSLLGLIGDILDVTRIETGHLQLAPQPVCLQKHVAEVVQLFEQQARSKGLQLLLELEGPADAEVSLDPLRFKQVLANLLSNAIKFTHRGNVRVSLRSIAQGGTIAVELTVEDTGIGIPDAELSRLGELFWQASNNRQSARRGAGLGLSISRTLCELMGGHMHLRSTLGVGTRIDLALRLERVDAREAMAAQEAPDTLPVKSESLRVLVVDDYPANRLLLANQLGYLGHRASVAEDGAQGLRAWLQGDFDVVISDCNMPVLDGYTLARAIRLHERRQGRRACRVLGLTANALVGERLRCERAGMDACHFKPLGLKALASALVGMQRVTDDAPVAVDNGVDLSNLERLTGGDPPALHALLNDLLASNRKDLAQLLDHGQHEDLAALVALAHRIKGGARIIRARAVIEACEQVERSCAGGSLPPGQLQAVCQALGELERVLQRYSTQNGAARGSHVGQVEQ